MDPTARDFVKFVSSCTSSQAGLPKQAKEKALLFSQKLVSGSRWEARLETLWEHLLQTISKLKGQRPSRQGLARLSAVLDLLKPQPEKLQHFCYAFLKQVGAGSLKSSGLFDFPVVHDLFQTVLGAVYSATAQRGWGFEEIEDWNNLIIEEILRTDQNTGQFQYSPEFMTRFSQEVLSLQPLQSISEGRLFTCLMAPFLLMVDECQDRNLRTEVQEGGVRILEQLLGQSSISLKEIQEVGVSLKDYEVQMEVEASCSKLIKVFKDQALAKEHSLGQNGDQSEAEQTKETKKSSSKKGSKKGGNKDVSKATKTSTVSSKSKKGQKGRGTRTRTSNIEEKQVTVKTKKKAEKKRVNQKVKQSKKAQKTEKSQPPTKSEPKKRGKQSKKEVAPQKAKIVKEVSEVDSNEGEMVQEAQPIKFSSPATRTKKKDVELISSKSIKKKKKTISKGRKSNTRRGNLSSTGKKNTVNKISNLIESQERPSRVADREQTPKISKKKRSQIVQDFKNMEVKNGPGAVQENEIESEMEQEEDQIQGQEQFLDITTLISSKTAKSPRKKVVNSPKKSGRGSSQKKGKNTKSFSPRKAAPMLSNIEKPDLQSQSPLASPERVKGTRTRSRSVTPVKSPKKSSEKKNRKKVSKVEKVVDSTPTTNNLDIDLNSQDIIGQDELLGVSSLITDNEMEHEEVQQEEEEEALEDYNAETEEEVSNNRNSNLISLGNLNTVSSGNEQATSDRSMEEEDEDEEDEEMPMDDEQEEELPGEMSPNRETEEDDEEGEDDEDEEEQDEEEQDQEEEDPSNVHFQNEESDFLNQTSSYNSNGNNDVTPEIDSRRKSQKYNIKVSESMSPSREFTKREGASCPQGDQQTFYPSAEQHGDQFQGDTIPQMKTEQEMYYGTGVKRDDWNENFGESMYPEDHEENNFKLEEEEEVEAQEDEDYEDIEDPYIHLSIEELKERLPLYMFKNPEEKVIYFQELNDNYFEEIQNAKNLVQPQEKNPNNVNFSENKFIRVFEKKTNSDTFKFDGEYDINKQTCKKAENQLKPIL